MSGYGIWLYGLMKNMMENGEEIDMSEMMGMMPEELMSGEDFDDSERITIRPAGRYLVYYHKGHYTTLDRAYEKISEYIQIFPMN